MSTPIPPPGTFTEFEGPISSLPSSSSPGLLFAASWLNTIESIYGSAPFLEQLKSLVAPGALFIPKSKDASTPIKKTLDVYLEEIKYARVNLARMSHTEHDVSMRDMVGADGKRTVVCEIVTFMLFRDDPRQQPVNISQMAVFTLDIAPEGKGAGGLWVTEVKWYFDPTAIRDKFLEISLG